MANGRFSPLGPLEARLRSGRARTLAGRRPGIVAAPPGVSAPPIAAKTAVHVPFPAGSRRHFCLYNLKLANSNLISPNLTALIKLELD